MLLIIPYLRYYLNVKDKKVICFNSCVISMGISKAYYMEKYSISHKNLDHPLVHVSDDEFVGHWFKFCINHLFFL